MAKKEQVEKAKGQVEVETESAKSQFADLVSQIPFYDKISEYLRHILIGIFVVVISIVAFFSYQYYSKVKFEQAAYKLSEILKALPEDRENVDLESDTKNLKDLMNEASDNIIKATAAIELGNIYRINGKLDDAKDYYEQVISLSDEGEYLNEIAGFEIANIESEKRNYDLAIKLYENLEKRSNIIPADIYKYHKALVLIAKGDAAAEELLGSLGKSLDSYSSFVSDGGLVRILKEKSLGK